MNAVLENIKARRSCRCYDPEKMPSEEILAEIAEAGTWAPTGKGLQKPIILVVTKPEMVSKIKKMNADIWGHGDVDPFYGAPCMMIVLCERWKNDSFDGACVMENMMLAAESVGLGSCWINRAREEFDSEEGKQMLKEFGIEGDYVGIGHVALGYALKPAPTPKPRKTDYIRWIR